MTVFGSSVCSRGKARRRCSAWTTVGALAAVAGAALLTAPTAVRAQTSATVPVSIVVGPVLYINLAGSFTFGSPADGDYTTGYLGSSAGPTLTHRGNVPYKITMQAQSGSTMSFVVYAGRSDANPGKPVTDLTLQATTGGTPGGYVAVGAAGSPNDFITRASRGPTLSSTLDGRLALSYANDPPGTYGTTILFTIVAQ